MNKKNDSGFLSGNRDRMRAGGWRTVLFALAWWILAGGAMDSWLIGVPAVLVATVASLVLLPPISFSPVGIVRFASYFLWRSLYGGVDVARRAMHPGLPVSPGLIEHEWRLPPGLPRVFMANVVSLQPGTLSMELGDDCLRVHVLDERGDFLPELEKVEGKVAAIFRIPLPPGKSDEMED